MTPAQLRLGIAVSIASATVLGIALGMAAPAITLALDRRGFDATTNGFMNAMPSIAALCVAPCVPALIARFGVRGLLAAGCILAAAGIGSLALLDDIVAWFVLRTAAGVGFALAWITIEVWITAASADANRGMVTGVYGALNSAGFAGGPLLLGAIGVSGGLPLFVAAGLVAVAALPLLAARGAVPPLAPAPFGNPIGPLREAPAAMAASLVNGLAFGTVFALIPLYGVGAGLGEEAAVLMLTALMVGNIALRIPVGRLADRRGPGVALQLCGIVGAAGALALPFVTGSGPVLWLLLFVWGGMLGSTYTLGMVGLGNMFGPDRIGGAFAAFVICYDVGALTGPPLAGLAIDLWGPNGLLIVVGAASLLLLIQPRTRGR